MKNSWEEHLKNLTRKSVNSNSTSDELTIPLGDAETIWQQMERRPVVLNCSRWGWNCQQVLLLRAAAPRTLCPTSQSTHKRNSHKTQQRIHKNQQKNTQKIHTMTVQAVSWLTEMTTLKSTYFFNRLKNVKVPTLSEHYHSFCVHWIWQKTAKMNMILEKVMNWTKMDIHPAYYQLKCVVSFLLWHCMYLY